MERTDEVIEIPKEIGSNSSLSTIYQFSISFRSSAFAGRTRGGRYGDVIEEFDWSAGEIVRPLESLGVDDETLVVFTNDNDT